MTKPTPQEKTTLQDHQTRPAFEADLQNALFLVWGAPQGSHRSQFFAQRLNIDITHIYLTRRQGVIYAIFKYPYQALITLIMIIRKQPEVVFIQDPPILAALPVYLYSFFRRVKFILDAHTDALLAPWWQWSLPLHRFLSRRAVTTIVTNEHLKNIVLNWGADSFVLTDPPITNPPMKEVEIDMDHFNVMVVSNVSYDEPIEQILEAAENLPDCRFYISGNYPEKRPDIVESAPDNVHFTGYIPDDEFYGLMKAVHIVLGLTTENHTLQSSANEALWMGKPIITSDWPLLRSYFHQGAIHIDNTSSGIRRAVQEMAANLPAYETGIRALQQERQQTWDAKMQTLIRTIANHQ